MLYSLDNHIAIVTGAAGLLGRNHCIALAEIGCNVIVTDNNKKNLNHFLSSVKDKSIKSKLYPMHLDITKELQVKNTISKIFKKFNRIDILINNASINPQFLGKKINFQKVENFSINNWNKEINVGLTGALICSKYIGPIMKKNNKGVILNIASDLSVIAPSHYLYNSSDDLENVKPISYSVIKHGIIGLTKYLSTYWHQYGIRVNALSPGGVYDGQDKSFVKKISKIIPLGRMANENEYKSSIQFLCTDASKYMTGQNIIIDGGRSVW